MTDKFIVEPLSKLHDRETFDCGEENLNIFLKRFARQNDAKGFSRTFVAVRPGEPKILGYYTLASGSFGFDLVPEDLPRYPVPVIHLGRLAVDRASQGMRLGQALLFHALERSTNIADQLGIYAVEVYALNRSAKDFYLTFGLTELADDKFHLYIPIKTIKKLLSTK